MDFDYPPKVQQLRQRLLEFMDEFVYPHEMTFQEQLSERPLAGSPCRSSKN